MVVFPTMDSTHFNKAASEASPLTSLSFNQVGNVTYLSLSILIYYLFATGNFSWPDLNSAREHRVAHRASGAQPSAEVSKQAPILNIINGIKTVFWSPYKCEYLYHLQWCRFQRYDYRTTYEQLSSDFVLVFQSYRSK